MRFAAKTLGRLGEERAAWFYRLRGYRILARNARSAAGEIDLVVRRGRTLAVVEVKTRQSLAAGEGFDAVDRRKRDQLMRLGGQWAARHPDAELRYDILSLFWNGWRFVVTHFPDAFRTFSDPVRPWRYRAE